jgi:hypothetical protein
VRLLDRLRNLVLVSRHELPGKCYMAVQVGRWLLWVKEKPLSGA